MSFKKSKQKSHPDLFATASFSLPDRERSNESIRFNLVWRQVVGLFNLSDECPSIDSYYKLFRRIAEYEQNHSEHVNLYKKIYQDLTARQIRKYRIAGRTIRMDNKLAVYEPVSVHRVIRDQFPTHASSIDNDQTPGIQSPYEVNANRKSATFSGGHKYK